MTKPRKNVGIYNSERENSAESFFLVSLLSGVTLLAKIEPLVIRLRAVIITIAIFKLSFYLNYSRKTEVRFYYIKIFNLGLENEVGYDYISARQVGQLTGGFYEFA